MKIWAIANQKGGVGKTTMAVTLAGILSNQGFRVLAVDFDPQASLTTYLHQEKVSAESNSYKIFQQAKNMNRDLLKKIICQTSFNYLDLIAAHPALATLERLSAKRNGLGLVLKKALHTVHHDYDYVVIDCPPALSVLLVNALACCDKLIIPVQTEFLAVKALDRIMHSIKMIENSQQRTLDISIVPTLFDPSLRTSHLVIEALKLKYKKNLWHSAIPLDAEVCEASFQGKLPSVYAPYSRAVFAYYALVDWLIKPDVHLTTEVKTA